MKEKSTPNRAISHAGNNIRVREFILHETRIKLFSLSFFFRCQSRRRMKRNLRRNTLHGARIPYDDYASKLRLFSDCIPMTSRHRVIARITWRLEAHRKIARSKEESSPASFTTTDAADNETLRGVTSETREGFGRDQQAWIFETNCVFLF